MVWHESTPPRSRFPSFSFNNNDDGNNDNDDGNNSNDSSNNNGNEDNNVSNSNNSKSNSSFFYVAVIKSTKHL